MQNLIQIKGDNHWKKPFELPEKESVVISVAPHAKVTLLERLKKGSLCHRVVRAGAYAQVRYVTIQELPATMKLEELRESEVSEGAHVHFFTCHLGAKEVKSSILHQALGPSAQCDTDLITRTRNNQSFQFILKNTYSKRNGLGVITAKGVAQDESALGIHGVIKIEQLAGGTDCHLNQAVLNLSPRAKVKATPALEIDTNDVKAAHSASVTNLSPEILFYLESRGLMPKAARKLLIDGFLKEEIDKLKDLPDIQKKIYNLL